MGLNSPTTQVVNAAGQRLTKNSTKDQTTHNTNIDVLMKIPNPTNANIMTLLGTLIGDMNNQFAGIANSMAEMRNDTKELREQQKSTDIRVDTLDQNVESLSYELNKFQQRDLINDVIVSGIPKCDLSYRDLLQKLNAQYQFGVENVADCYKTKVKDDDNKPSYFIIKFKNNKSKIQLIKSKIAHGPLYVQQFMTNSTVPHDKQIYISDRLTPYNQNILAELRKLKKDGKMYHCYYRHGNIFAKITKDDRDVKLIKTKSDVTKLGNRNTSI